VYFKCEIFNDKGKIIEERHVEVSVGTVDDATTNVKVQALKKKARDQGFGFRVQRMDN
jgi:hypothetical protein